MSPDLALTLSFEGIGLLARIDRGWHLLGEVGLDSEDLVAELSNLRALAVQHGGEDFATLLVLPNDQIKFLQLKTGRLRGAKLDAEVAKTLEAETPYSVEQLVFDTSTASRVTQVAAVARDTLAEAEAFAAEHAFNPVWFTAIPDVSAYGAAPNFGATQITLSSGIAVAFDATPLEIVGTGPLPVEPEPALAPSPKPEPEAVVETAAVTPQAEADVAKDSVAPPDAVKEEEPTAPLEATDTETPAVAFSSRRQSPDASAAPQLGGVSRDPPASQTSDLPPVQPTRDATLRFDPARVVAGLKTDNDAGSDDAAQDLGDQTQDKKPAKTGLTFFGRRKAAVATALPNAEMPIGEDTLVAGTPDATHGRDKRRKERSKEKDQLTIFGSRPTEVCGKPRHLGLVLTTLLLVFLAGVALWVTYFVEDGVAGLFDNANEDVVVVVQPQASQPLDAVPEVDTSEQADADAIEPTELSTETAAIDTEALAPTTPDTITDSAEVEALLDGDDPLALSAREAEARYAVTGIWQKAPQSPAGLQGDNADSGYVPAIDVELGALDAIALPAPSGLLTDISPRAQSIPPVAGSQFDFDERGLVAATAEGALTPEGVRVFAGRPPILPTSYPQRLPEIDTEASDEAAAKLASLRPRVRPSDLLETNQRATLGGLTLNELAQIRPKLRPANAKAEAEADNTPTKLAVKSSPRPRAKPSNIAQLAQRATATAPVVEAVPAAATVTPAIPTTASVARQATIQNAINLRKINLIGVYGTASNRRALVRLSNGRYKKVQVGDRIDGGKVAAIGESELRYVKSGKNVTLQMPKG
ncbi:MAG: hypothetical protein ACU0A6_16510 [Shimia sp.]|uniref:hypothetical protein n=1 Tax=Shimia sp. TaxID=1954381 RepID=UPI0040599708